MRLRLILPILLLLFAPTVTFGQSTTTTATSSQAASTVDTPPTETQQWYTVERLTGRLDVGDFVVGPGRTEVTLEPGQSTTQYITVANRISEQRTFKLEVADISGTTDGSSALQVIEGQRGPYSILDYISFPEATVTLNLGERARIPVTISIPSDAEPGGLYGSILVSTVRAGTARDGDTAPQNPIIARVGSHLFITVEGEKEVSGRTLDVAVLPTQLWYESGPLTFAIAYENTGSVHVNPYGELSITNTFGDQVGYVEIEPWFVLPNSLRTREVTWDREFLFGRYTAKVTMNRGYDDILDEVEVTFWVLPWKILLLIFGSIFICILVFRLFFKTFEFKRRS